MAHARIAGRVGTGASVVDGVGHFLFDFLGELLLELVGDDAGAGGVGGVGSLRHCGGGGVVGESVCGLVDVGDGV